jgi:hypothetical protein
MTANRAPDDVGTAEAAAHLGLRMHRVQQVVREGFVPQPVKGRVGLIAAAIGHVAALRADARDMPTPAARRSAAKRDDTAREAILKAEDDALIRLDRLARRADPARRAAIRAAQARIRQARAEAIWMLRNA